MLVERYRLTLTHHIVDTEKVKDPKCNDYDWEVDKPIHTEMIIDRSIPASIVVNEMLQRLGDYLLRQVK